MSLTPSPFLSSIPDWAYEKAAKIPRELHCPQCHGTGYDVVVHSFHNNQYGICWMCDGEGTIQPSPPDWLIDGKPPT